MTTINAMAQADNKKALLDHINNVATNRDRHSFEYLFDYFVPKLRAYNLARQPGDGLIADELAQTVMIKVWEKAHLFNPAKANLSTWVFTLARNSRVDYLRKNSRYTNAIDPEFIWLDNPEPEDGPELNLEDMANNEKIHEALNQLPSDQKVALYRVYFEGKTHQQISDQEDIPLGTVKSRIRLALGKLSLSFNNVSLEAIAS
jgi:RNA polymerase sigma factor (sigma-70 family)